MSENIYFDCKKEKGESFYVEYCPPRPSIPFATLSVTYITNVSPEVASSELERQCERWIRKYPIPIMGTVFDKESRVLNLDTARPSSHLTVLLVDNNIEKRWDFLRDEEFPENALNNEHLLLTYKDFSCKTQSEINNALKKKYKGIRTFKLVLMFWVLIVPVVIATLEFISSIWVAVIALLYSYWKAYQQWLVMSGKKEKSDEELDKEEEELRMRHHHYHCERNPDGFLALKLENFRRESEEKVKNEYGSLQ